MDSNGGSDRFQDELMIFPGGRTYLPYKLRASHVIYTLLALSYFLIVVLFITTLTRAPKPAQPLKNNDTIVALANIKSNVQAVSTKAEAIQSDYKANVTQLKTEVASAADNQKSLRDEITVLQTKIGTLISKVTDLQNSMQKEAPANACGEGSTAWVYYGGSCYLFSKVKSNWMAGKKSCESRNATLAIITSEGEQKFITSKSNDERYWIGLTDVDEEGEWQWIDGTDYKISMKFWKEGEPNNDRQREDCAHVWVGGEWNDVHCTYLCYTLCEKTATLQ